MALAVVNYPAISEKDFQWIQAIRKEHDNVFYEVVQPHFTFVFPIKAVETDLILIHVKYVAEQFEPFDFIARCVTVGDSDFWDHAHVFLIPDEGFSNIVKLHDALYRGPLASELRLDLPFVPHIGIASYPNPETCKELVDRLHNQNFEIRGAVENLDIVEFDGDSTRTIEQVSLIKQ